MEILIATNNKDKFNIVSKMIKTITNNDINLKSLLDIEQIPEKKRNRYQFGKSKRKGT